MRWLIILWLLPLAAGAQSPMPALGLWREHLPYQHAIDITASAEKIFAATPHSLISISRQTGEVQRLSKVSGLSETGISRIHFDTETSRLVIAYANSNIDIVSGGRVVNMPDLMRSTVNGDKSVYKISTRQGKAFLATGMGVVVANLQKAEVQELWPIVAAGNLPVYDLAFSGDSVYAATANGLLRMHALANGSNPASWQQVLITGPAAVRGLASFAGSLAAVQNDTVFLLKSGRWNFLYANGWKVNSINAAGQQVLVTQRATNGEAQVVLLDANGLVANRFSQPGFISYPVQAMQQDGFTWIADLYGGLTRWQGSSFTHYRLPSPLSIGSGELAATSGKIVATAGSVNNAWNYLFNPNGFDLLDQQGWRNFSRYHQPVLDSVSDIIAAAMHPVDGSTWLGSFGGGLIHVTGDNRVSILKQGTPLRAPAGDPGRIRVSGLAFDQQQNLWVANFGASAPLHVRKKDGSWQSFTPPFSLRENALSQVVIDDAGNKWIVSPLNNGLVVFNENVMENAADDRWRLVQAGAANSNLPSSNVLAVAKDRDGLIWVGTANGAAYFSCFDNVFSPGCAATLPVVKEGNFSNYLFAGQEVRSIAVDGANRKWMATASGAWLVSAEGERIIHHFAEGNSPLLSNDVRKIAIEPATGEVFFATAKGLISYRASATENTEASNKVLVFPNPVPPAFAGMIGIRGLPENCEVKIMEPNGRVVFQTRALGTQATWSGLDAQGRRAASGVYLVMAIDEKKQQRMVAKIVIVNGN